MINNTTNQHYVSQAELRLSAINPMAAPNKKKIYKYRVLDRENYKLSRPEERKVENSLSYTHLFSFEFGADGFKNFESLFLRYESESEFLTLQILNNRGMSRGGASSLVKRLFSLKWLNSLRNPFCIRRTLAFLDFLKDVTPTGEEQKRVYESIKNSRSPQQSHVAKKFGVTVEEYNIWLRTLYIVLMKVGEDEDTFLSSVVERIFSGSELGVHVEVFSYSADACLIPDVGHVIFPGDDGAYAFNLTKNSFIVYYFRSMVEGNRYNIDKTQLRPLLASGLNITLSHTFGRLDVLAGYNKHVIAQSVEFVFSGDGIVRLE